MELCRRLPDLWTVAIWALFLSCNQTYALGEEGSIHHWLDTTKLFRILVMVIVVAHLFPLLCIIPAFIHKHHSKLARDDHKVIQVFLRLHSDYTAKHQTFNNTIRQRAQEIAGHQHQHHCPDFYQIFHSFVKVQWFLQWLWVSFTIIVTASGTVILEDMRYLPCYIIAIIHILVLVDTFFSPERLYLKNMVDVSKAESQLDELREQQPDMAFHIRCWRAKGPQDPTETHKECKAWFPNIWMDVSDDKMSLSENGQIFRLHVETAFIPGNRDTTDSMLSTFQLESEKAFNALRDNSLDSSMLFNCQKLSEYRMMLVTKGQIPWGQRLCVNQVTMWLCTLLGGMVVYRLALSKLLQRHEVQTHILIKRFFRKATFQDYDGIQPSIYNPDKSLYLKKESRFAFLKRFNKKKHYSGIKEREAKNPELPDDITKKCKV